VTRFDPAVDEFQWLLTQVIDCDHVLAMCGVDGLDGESTSQMLGAAGDLIGSAIAPISEQSDRIGATLQGGRVFTPPAWKEAYRAWRDNGWSALSAPPSHGGQGMPFLLQACVATMLGGADLGFAMVAVSARAAASVLFAHADPDLSAICVPRLASGEWTATIAITEPQAGSDVGLITTRAARSSDGHFRIFGSKIFISGGDHDLTEQILHLVLARTEGAASGVKGLSLFLVPSRVFSPAGTLLVRNSVAVSRIEEKMGLHGSPTCAMDFDGAQGVMIGAEGAGLACLFTMMYELRIEVALNAVGISTCATSHAQAYAGERRQGRSPGGAAGAVPIACHPDVQRMLMIMHALTDGGRALVLETARHMDLARLAPAAPMREEARARLEWLLPICKATLSDNAVEIANLGIQVRGGHGFVRDSGAEQFLRDVRVLPIYEGTNGIHAIDLVTRRLQRGGRGYPLFVADVRADLKTFEGRTELTDNLSMLQRGIEILTQVSDQLIGARGAASESGSLFAAKAYLDLAGRVAMAWMWLRMAAAASSSDTPLCREKRVLARFFASYYEPEFHLHAARVHTALQEPNFSIRAA
jgi:alkylation response protein AidB-like acyl-CoA dehydrogenase